MHLYIHNRISFSTYKNKSLLGFWMGLCWIYKSAWGVLTSKQSLNLPVHDYGTDFINLDLFLFLFTRCAHSLICYYGHRFLHWIFLLLVSTNTVDYFVSCDLAKFTYSSSILASLRFSTYIITSPLNKDRFTSFFPLPSCTDEDLGTVLDVSVGLVPDVAPGFL